MAQPPFPMMKGHNFFSLSAKQTESHRVASNCSHRHQEQTQGTNAFSPPWARKYVTLSPSDLWLFSHRWEKTWPFQGCQLKWNAGGDPQAALSRVWNYHFLRWCSTHVIVSFPDKPAKVHFLSRTWWSSISSKSSLVTKHAGEYGHSTWCSKHGLFCF